MNLETEQRDKLFEIGQAYRKEVFDAETKMEQGRHNMRKAWHGEKVDESSLRENIDTMTAAFKAKLEAKMNFMASTRKVLTPETAQKHSMKNMRESRQRKRRR